MFSIRLKQLREDAGYKSQQAFADAFGIAQSTVGNWEAGKREPNYETTIRLAMFLNTSTDYLLGYASYPPTLSAVSTSFDPSRIDRFRVEMGMTLEVLAGRAGIPVNALSDIETGKASPSIDSLMRIADALSCSLDVLTGYTWGIESGNFSVRPGENPLSDPLRSTLLRNFDQLSEDGQTRLVETSDDMVASGKYIKTAPSGLGKEA